MLPETFVRNREGRPTIESPVPGCPNRHLLDMALRYL